MDEPKHSGNSLDRTTAFIGFAIVFALLLAFAAYFVVQVNQLNNKISTAGGNDVSDRLLSIENRLSIIERSLAPSPIKLKLFYNSADDYTKDVVERVAAAQADLAAQNLQVTLSDRKDDMEQYRRDGFNAVPYLFISQEEASRDKNLLNSLLDENHAFDGIAEGFRLEALGFIYERKHLLETACKLPDGRVSLDLFTSFECAFCAGMHGQATDYAKAHADVIKFIQRHFPLPSQPNAWNASIAAECAREQGKFAEFTTALFPSNKNLSTAAYLAAAKTAGVADLAKFQSCLSDETPGLAVNRDYTEAHVTYGLRSAPVFVADCQYAFIALTEQQLADQLCHAYPNKCATFALNATASPAPTATPAATPKASDTPTG